MNEIRVDIWYEHRRWNMKLDESMSWGVSSFEHKEEALDALEILLKLNVEKRIGVESKGRVHNPGHLLQPSGSSGARGRRGESA